MIVDVYVESMIGGVSWNGDWDWNGDGRGNGQARLGGLLTSLGGGGAEVRVEYLWVKVW
jgi:hypothetical protein